MSNRNRPIGLFDSGLGGLTVAKQILSLLPNEEIIYLGDMARFPYGNRSPEIIRKFSSEAANFLHRHKVKMIIVACNTVSSVNIDWLKRKFPIPVVGVIRPGVRMALEVSRNKRVGVIGTAATIDSKAVPRAVHRINPKVKVFAAACPMLVLLAEEGSHSEKAALSIARHYLIPLKLKRIDTLVLACTHYPLILNLIKRVLGPSVKVIDPADGVAIQTRMILKRDNLLRDSKKRPRHKFYVTDHPERLTKAARRLIKNSKITAKRVSLNHT